MVSTALFILVGLAVFLAVAWASARYSPLVAIGAVMALGAAWKLMV